MYSSSLDDYNWSTNPIVSLKNLSSKPVAITDLDRTLQNGILGVFMTSQQMKFFDSFVVIVVVVLIATFTDQPLSQMYRRI